MQLSECESLLDLKAPPTSWKGAMEALTHGAVDWDEAEPLLWTCAEIAQAIEPDWLFRIDDLVNRLATVATSDDEAVTLASALLALGTDADEAIAKGAAQ